MAVSGITSATSADRIYSYANTHYNQVQGSAVTPITRARSVAGLIGGEDRIKTVAVYQNSEETEADGEDFAVKKQAALSQEYQAQDKVQYDVSNPYEAARMSVESSFLVGMHFDMTA